MTDLPLALILLLAAIGASAYGITKWRKAARLPPGRPPQLPPTPPPVPEPIPGPQPIPVGNDERWLLGLSSNYQSRDNQIISRVQDLQFDWFDLTIVFNGHVGTFGVFRDGAKIDGIRITVDASVAQRIADILGCSLTTPKLEDEIYITSTVKVPILTEASDNTMGTNRVMIAHSKKIDSYTMGRAGLIGGIGKSWCLGNILLTKPDKAINYGFFAPNAPHLSVTGRTRVIQQPGTAHNAFHWDYSQNLRLVSNICVVDGVERNLKDIMADPELSGLVSVDGPLRVFRQPGVPLQTSA